MLRQRDQHRVCMRKFHKHKINLKFVICPEMMLKTELLELRLIVRSYIRNKRFRQLNQKQPPSLFLFFFIFKFSNFSVDGGVLNMFVAKFSALLMFAKLQRRLKNQISAFFFRLVIRS